MSSTSVDLGFQSNLLYVIINSMAETKVGGTVWHVEDGDSWRNIVSSILTRDGHQVVSTPNATEARRMIPDDLQGVGVSILDGDLGDGTGAEIAGLIRQSQLAIGIIGLSAGNSPWADASLSKLSFDAEDLKATVDRFLGTQE